MAERMIVDLALIPNNMMYCPICGRELSHGIILYRYTVDQCARVSYTRMLSCEKCNEYFATTEMMDSLRSKLKHGSKKNRQYFFPTHSINLIQRKSAKKEYNLSQYGLYEKKHERDIQTFKPLSTSTKNNGSIPKAEIIKTQIEKAPIPSFGPIANSTISLMYKPNDCISDLTILSELVNACPVCHSDFSKERARYKYRVNGELHFAYSELQYCKSCRMFYGTISYLDHLEKSVIKSSQLSPENANIVMHYHYYGEVASEEIQPAESIRKGKLITPKQQDTATNFFPEKHNTSADNTLQDSFYTLFQKYDAPNSTILIIRYEDIEMHEEPLLFIVDDEDDHDGAKHQYYISSDVGNRIAEAIITKRDRFFLNTESFKIILVYKRSDFENRMKSRARIARVISQPTELVDVYVYSLRGLCRRHGDKTERLVVNMISSRSQNPHPLEVYYCPVCEKFYVNYETYFNFYKRYGMPPLRLYGDSEAGLNGNAYAALREKSDLNLFGYNVSGELAEDPYLRCAILEDIIDSGNLTKAQVMSHLEWLIRFGKHNEKMKNAITRWHSDLVHIEQYQPRRTNIWGQFKPGSDRIFL